MYLQLCLQCLIYYLLKILYLCLLVLCVLFSCLSVRIHGSIMGESDSPGVIPQFAEELFERIEMQTERNVSL